MNHMCKSVVCFCISIFGCTDSVAVNYDAAATSDTGSCAYPGCTDSNALTSGSLAGTAAAGVILRRDCCVWCVKRQQLFV